MVRIVGGKYGIQNYQISQKFPMQIEFLSQNRIRLNLLPSIPTPLLPEHLCPPLSLITFCKLAHLLFSWHGKGKYEWEFSLFTILWIIILLFLRCKMDLLKEVQGNVFQIYRIYPKFPMKMKVWVKRGRVQSNSKNPFWIRPCERKRGGGGGVFCRHLAIL